MPVDHTQLLVNNIKKLLRRGAIAHLHKIIEKSHSADLSGVFQVLSLREQKAFLDLMTKESSEEIEELLGYDPKTAGGIMVADVIALKEKASAKEAIKTLQKDYFDTEMPFYLYVIGDYGHLNGVVSLRQLVVVPPDTKLKSIMNKEVVSVQTNTDQEEVAKIVAHYNILAVPVVDESNKLVGIVTVDDVIDIIHEEATEDIFKMAGVGGSVEYIETQTIFKSIRKRLPWLLASWFGGIVACRTRLRLA